MKFLKGSSTSIPTLGDTAEGQVYFFTDEYKICYDFKDGNNSTIKRFSSNALGKNTVVNGVNSFASGEDIVINGDWSSAFGKSITVNGAACFSSGYLNTIPAGFSSSAAIGVNLTVDAPNQLVIGESNEATSNEIVKNLFVVGNDNRNALVVNTANQIVANVRNGYNEGFFAKVRFSDSLSKLLQVPLTINSYLINSETINIYSNLSEIKLKPYIKISGSPEILTESFQDLGNSNTPIYMLGGELKACSHSFNDALLKTADGTIDDNIRLINNKNITTTNGTTTTTITPSGISTGYFSLLNDQHSTTQAQSVLIHNYPTDKNVHSRTVDELRVDMKCQKKYVLVSTTIPSDSWQLITLESGRSYYISDTLQNIYSGSDNDLEIFLDETDSEATDEQLKAFSNLQNHSSLNSNRLYCSINPLVDLPVIVRVWSKN